MKKYLVLTSVLALAACGGGGHGGHGGGVTGGVDAVTAAVESNKKITGMLTYLETDSTGSTVNSRGASTRNGSVSASSSGGIFDMSDVKFAAADEDLDPKDDGFTFVVNKATGRIIGIDMGLTNLEDYPEDGPAYFKREGDTNIFTGLVNVGDDDNEDSKWVDARLEYNSVGRDINLQYADFGNIKINAYDDETQEYKPEQTMVFIGGYDDAKRMDTDAIAKTTEFSGRATGGVVAVLHGQGSGRFLDLDAEAKLVFDKSSGTSTMNANFDNWYNVEYTKTGNEAGSMKFTRVEGREVDEDFYFLSDKSNGNKGWTTNPTAEDLRYFGSNGVAEEVVGLVHIRDCGGNPCDNDYGDKEHPNPEVRMNMAFGAKTK